MLRTRFKGRRSARGPAWSRSRWRWVFDTVLTVAILGLLILLSARLERVETRSLEGQAIVNDGDSLTLGADRVRLRGMDAPELSQTCRKDGADYPCGRRARDALAGLIGGRPVDCTGWERDRYGRLLAACTAGGRDLNRALVESGWAVSYGDFQAEERAARQNGAGLWAGSFDPPREWRERHGGMVESEHGATGRILNWLRQVLRFS